MLILPDDKSVQDRSVSSTFDNDRHYLEGKKEEGEEEKKKKKDRDTSTHQNNDEPDTIHTLGMSCLLISML